MREASFSSGEVKYWTTLLAGAGVCDHAARAASPATAMSAGAINFLMMSPKVFGGPV
jgi:hypothetical protein